MFVKQANIKHYNYHVSKHTSARNVQFQKRISCNMTICSFYLTQQKGKSADFQMWNPKTLQLASLRYYVNGVMLTGVQIIDGCYYEFDEDGICESRDAGSTVDFRPYHRNGPAGSGRSASPVSLHRCRRRSACICATPESQNQEIPAEESSLRPAYFIKEKGADQWPAP